MPRKKTINIFLRVALTVFTIIIGCVLGIGQIKPPPADPTSPAFQRMMSNIERLTQNPRYNNSDEIEIVRAQIIAEIEEMGLTPIIQKAAYTSTEVNTFRQRPPLNEMFFRDGILHIQNILVKLHAPDTDRGILFVSHLDSWANSPGATDSMVAVCAILETMRVHAPNNALANNIYFLFTDAEELGLLGAWTFLEGYPELMDKIDMVINIDSNGSRGALILYETSPEAHSLLRVFKKAVEKPVGFSVAATAYERMNLHTDFTLFLRYGWQGINLASLAGREHNHSPSDTYDNLDSSTAWHHLVTALALADYAANNSLEQLQNPSERAVFFPFLPGNLVLLSFTLAYLLCAIACLLAFTFMVYQYKNKELNVSFSTIGILILALFSIFSAIFFHTGSYLFWLPLFAVSLTTFLKRWTVAYRIAQILSGITACLLWSPLIYLLWEIIR